MHQTTLNDAALALSRVLTFHRIHHTFFGGFAILATGADHRESKDLDVLVSAPKSTITHILSDRRDWLEIPHSREDYVAYFWNSSSFSTSPLEPKHMVLVEMFVGQHDKAHFPESRNTVLKGCKMGTSYVPIANEDVLFRGKLNACASRGKRSDAQDVDYLVATYGERLKVVAKSLDKRTVGLAVRRHPELRKVLAELGVGTRGAVWGVRKAKIEAPAVPQMWDVHRGLGLECV